MKDPDALLLESFPDIPWVTPIPITVGETTRLGCRLCIARFGLKAIDVKQLYSTEEEHQAHIKQFHYEEGT